MFHIILSILVAILTVVDAIIVLGVFGVPGIGDIIHAHLGLYIILVSVQIPILFYVVYRSYIHPIEQLKQGIARFHMGLDDAPNISVQSWSKGMLDIIGFFQKSLKVLSVFRDEVRAGRQLRSEVEIASEIQKQTLSQEDDVMPGLDLAVGICSASEVWGDSIDVISGSNGNYYLYVGDVTGHWVPSGFVMMMVNALISAFTRKMLSGAEILAETNKILKPRIKTNMMMTTVMLRWDSLQKKMYYTGAGHEFILVYKSQEQQVYKVKTGGVALGMMRDITRALKEQQIAFVPGDLIILYTDGITEARYRSEQNGMLFGVDRMTESIMKLGVRTPESVFRQLTLDLSAFMGYKHKQYDDITLAVVGFTPEWQESVMMMDIPSRIDATSITEWNWGLTKQ